MSNNGNGKTASASLSRHESNESDQVTKERLLQGCYHLPGNSYAQDLLQYFCNTHPLLGIWFHHPLHPISGSLRAAFFIGSLAFGLAVSNIIYVAFVIDNSKYNATYYNLQVNKTVTGYSAIDSQLTQVSVTNGMIALWTLGGVLNALYDSFIWTIASCQCLNKKQEGNDRLRFYVIMFIVLGVVTGSTLVVLIRATLDSNQQTADLANKLQLKYTPHAESYRFLISFAVEVALSLFVWYFVVGLVLFTGVLGCNARLPVLGGRPYEIKRLEQEKQKVASKRTSRSSSNGV
jgi:hypothetical protein